LWIIMWMSDQNYAVSQHLTDCPIDRQHNPCKFIKMQSLTEICMSDRIDSARSEMFFTIGVPKCADWQSWLPDIIDSDASRNRQRAVSCDAIALFAQDTREGLDMLDVSTSKRYITCTRSRLAIAAEFRM